MKNIIKSLALVAAAAFVASCDLSEYNPNEYGEGAAFGSASAIQLALNTFYYSELPKLSSAYDGEFGESDYVIANSMSGRYTQAYSPENVDEWANWTDMRNINYFLQMMDSDACGVTGDVKDNFVGQGRFFRAKMYFSYLKKYGDVPYYDHMLTAVTNDEYKERDSRDLIIKKINEDLDYAIEHITAESPDATGLTKYVAAFVKMRANLFEASFRKYNNVNASVTGESFKNYSVEDLYNEAIKAAEVIMNSGKFSLVSDYRKLFTSDALQKDEVILGAATSSTVMGSQNSKYNYGNQRSFVRPFINTFLMKDGSAYTAKSGYATETFAQEFANRDPRLAKIVRTPGYKYDGKVVVPGIADMSAPLGYQIIKFSVDYCPDGNNDKTGGANTNSAPVYRYAEVLLSYAEAKAELGQLTDADWAKTVGAIRQRAGITGGISSKPTTVDSYLKANFYPNVDDAAIMEIRRERGCELCLEGTREDDLLRWGCGSTIVNLAWDGINFPALDTPFDADNDGAADYYFTAGNAPSEYADIAVKVNAQTGLNAVANGSVMKLTYPIASTLRYWADNRILVPISYLTIAQYKDHGYTITQNPGY